MFVSLALVNAALLLPTPATAQSDVAPCHQDSSTPLPSSHHHSNHDCCTVGHNRALASAVAQVSGVSLLCIDNIVPHIARIGSEQHPLPEFNDSGPPASVPLRI